MPLNRLHVPHSIPAETTRALNELLHTSLVETCGVNPDDHFCLVNRYADGDILVHPTFLGDRDPAATIVVEITLLAGRSDAQKEALYADFRARVPALGITPNNIIIFLVENSPIDFSFSEAGSVKKVLGL